VEKPNAERPTYEGREIVLGPRAGDHYLIESGLAAGERVVTNGAFKIDSALQIQAKPSMMSQAIKTGDSLWVLSAEETDILLPFYFELQAALADDDLSGAKEAINQLRANWANAPDHLLVPMLEATTLDAARRPFFESISNIFIQAIQQPEYDGDDAIYLMHCPMVYEDRGADWLQASEPLQNPYFGSMMLTCGEVKEALNNQ
jgi:Cu(I)/Ag(I) efflux system membrane fusion protein